MKVLQVLVKKTCPECEKEFESYKRFRKRFCDHSCAAKYNNKHRVRKDAKKIILCKNCGKGNKNKIFCSVICHSEHKSKTAYNEFLKAEDKLYSQGYSPKTFKKYILIEQNNKCEICKIENKWNDKDLMFILDHIDGNSDNNNRNNLRLVCPNCDTQLPTYKSKNKGSGRHYRNKRRNEGKSF